MRGAIPAAVYADLLHAPYVDGGRGPGYDCVGLVLELLARLGRALPAYLSDEAALHRAVAAGGPLSEAVRIDAPEPGCLVLMRSDEALLHVGAMVDRHRMIHTYRQLGRPAVVVLENSMWRRRVQGFYLPFACGGLATDFQPVIVGERCEPFATMQWTSSVGKTESPLPPIIYRRPRT